MTDLALVIASAETTLHEMARQASGLANGLKNAAPGDKKNTPNKSIEYLDEIADKLREHSVKCKELLTASLPNRSGK